MSLVAGQTINVFFEVAVGATPTNLSNLTATLIRSGIDTTIPTTISNPETGRYHVTATLGAWNDGEQIHMRLEGDYASFPRQKITKDVGVITDIGSRVWNYVKP